MSAVPRSASRAMPWRATMLDSWRRRGHARLDLRAALGRERAVGEAREIGELVVAQPMGGFRFHALIHQ